MSETDLAERPSVPEPAVPTYTGPRRPGITGRGAFLLILVPTLAGCVIGFVISGATMIPALAGWGLIAGSVVAALKSAPRLSWFPVCFPPLVMLLVIVTAGQFTLLGTRPGLAREITMVMANLTATAPAQVAAVVSMALVLLLRRQFARRAQSSAS